MTITQWIELGLMGGWIYMTLANYFTLRSIRKLLKSVKRELDRKQDKIDYYSRGCLK